MSIYANRGICRRRVSVCSSVRLCVYLSHSSIISTVGICTAAVEYLTEVTLAVFR